MDWTDYQYAGEGKMSESDLNAALQRREQENQQFQQFQRGPTQIAESIKPPSELGKEFYREGFWAVPDLPHTHHLPYPQEGQNWQGKDVFLGMMKLVQNQLRRDMVRYKQDDKCCLCGQDKLGNGEFVDRNNKVIWRESYDHYIGQHNVVPTKFFFNYIQQASQAVGRKTTALHVPPPAPAPAVVQNPQQFPPHQQQPINNHPYQPQPSGQQTPLERLQQGSYFPPQPTVSQPPPNQQYPQYYGQPQQPLQQPNQGYYPQQPQSSYQQPNYQQQQGQVYVPPYMQPRQ